MMPTRLSIACTLICAAAVPALSRAETASGYTVSFAGNSGNPVSTTATVVANAPGTYTSGSITGATGNTASADFTISASPRPSLLLNATGNDPDGFNGTAGFATASFAYTIAISGPQSGTAVLIDFSGDTSAEITASGSASLFYNSAGTRLTLGSPGIASTISDRGSVGTAPTVNQPFQGSPDTVFIGWGADAASGPSNQSYQDHFSFGFSATAGSPLSVLLSGIAQGGLTGTATPTSVSTSGTTRVYLDPYFYIDPAWASTHPGYSLEVETGVGNAAPVPEPSSAVLIVAGLLALWGVGSIGQRFNYAAT